MLYYTSGIILLSILNNFVTYAQFSPKRGFTTLFEWTQIDFDYPTPNARQQDIDRGVFIPGQPTMLDVDVYYSGFGVNKIFVTHPRNRLGVPAALGTISAKSGNRRNPVITPYPSWSWHTDPERCKPNRMVSVYRVTIDECGRMWVLDTGKLVNTIICPPQILIFDLKTDRLIHRYEIPNSQLESRSILATPMVEVLDKRNQCQNSFAYLADCRFFSIIVYDLRRDISWVVSDKSMFPYPNYGTYTVGGDSFELMDGVLGMSLSPAYEPQRKLFYHSLTSPTENWVYTAYLRNQSLFSSGTSPTSIFNTFPGQRQTQAAAEAIDDDGIMYFGLVNVSQIACYNTKAGSYGSSLSSDIIAENPETLQFASGVKVIRNERGEEDLWLVTSKFGKIALDIRNPNDINFRILTANVKELVQGTQCARNGFLPNQSQYGLLPPRRNRILHGYGSSY